MGIQAVRSVLHWAQMSGASYLHLNQSLDMGCPRMACPWVRRFSVIEANPEGAGPPEAIC